MDGIWSRVAYRVVRNLVVEFTGTQRPSSGLYETRHDLRFKEETFMTLLSIFRSRRRALQAGKALV